MSNQRIFYQKCVCGAEFQVSDSYDFMPTSATLKTLDTWRLQHKTCLPLFHKIQEARMEQLKLATPQNLLNEVIR